jgi:hypothetical protein
MKNKQIFVILLILFLALIIVPFLSEIPNVCGIENCHGLDIECGPNIPDACTEIYMLGDKCRQYASCEIIEGKCQLIRNSEFETCKSCIENCLERFPNGGNPAFECESNC